MRRSTVVVVAVALLMVLHVETSAAGEYTIRKGDTPVYISRKHGITLEEFARLNPGLNYRNLRIGDKVRVDAERSRGETPSAQPKAAVQVSSEAGSPDLSKSAAPAAGPGLGGDQRRDAVLDSSGEAGQNGQAGAVRDSGFAVPDTARGSGNEPSVAVSFLRVVGALVLVAVLAYLSLLALRGTLVRNACGGKRRCVRVVETAALGANRTLHVVEVEGKRMLIGSTPGQMTLLADLEGTPEQDDEPETQRFQSILSRLAPSHDRAQTAGRVSRLLRDGAAFLHGRGAAARSLRGEVDEDAT